MARRIANALIGAGVVLIVVLVWYGMRPNGLSTTQRSSATLQTSPAEQSQRQESPPLAATAKFASEADQLSTIQRRSANEALQALETLQSATSAGVNHQEYLRRVVDAKIQVDRYLQDKEGDAAIKRGVQDAMRLYIFASSAWSAKIARAREDQEEISDDPAIELCPIVKSEVDEMARKHNLAKWARAEYIAALLPIIWQCASEKIAEIERGIKER